MRAESPRFGARHPRLGPWAYRVAIPVTRWFAGRLGVNRFGDAIGRERAQSFRELRRRSRSIYLLGLGAGGHDAGASLVQVDSEGVVHLLASHAEERFVGESRYASYPCESIESIREDLAARGLGPSDLHACLLSFDYAHLFARGAENVVESLPGSLGLIHPGVYGRDLPAMWRALWSPDRLAGQLELSHRLPTLGMSHHGSHAFLSWATSPFARSPEPVLVAVLDATGDDSSISRYLAVDGRLAPRYQNHSYWDSLGHLYGFLSSRYGGWPLGQSEGRWMAAAAYGDLNRATNPYYESLRELLHFGEAGGIYVDRRFVNWHKQGERRPFSAEIVSLMGPPIPSAAIATSAVALSFEPSGPSGESLDRAHQAAATQLVFEDALFHVVSHGLRESGSRRLVLTGGTALNCSATLRVLERLADVSQADAIPDLEVWVPPAPADDGTHAGAAYQFALRCGAAPGPSLQDVYTCGRPPAAHEIETAVAEAPGLTFDSLGETSETQGRHRVAKEIAVLLASGHILGLFQGRGELGRRALGHRSILADPRDAKVPTRINREVKLREPFRPVAPMCTLRGARRWFELNPAAAADDFNAYRWMAMAVRARPDTSQRLPAVVHRDGTARIQIVPESEMLTFAVLEALGERIGAEVAVNTSLNRGGPIVQTPRQAVSLLTVGEGLSGLVFVSGDGSAFLVYREGLRPQS